MRIDLVAPNCLNVPRKHNNRKEQALKTRQGQVMQPLLHAMEGYTPFPIPAQGV